MGALTLNNFQAWEEASVVVEGLTVIVGPSNRGKSSFARAFRGVLRNDVSERRIRRGTKCTTVTTDFSGTALEVRRTSGTKGETTYRVGDQDYAKLGGKVPPPVEALNVGSVKVGDYTLDPIFAGQFDSQFLLASTPAEVTAVLNAFASTDKLDKGRRVLTSRTNDLNAEGRALGALISQGEDDFAKADAAVTAAAPCMERVQSALAKVTSLRRALRDLESLVALWGSEEQTRASLASLERLEGRLAQAIAGLKVAARAQRAAVAAHSFSRLTREIAQVTTLEGVRERSVRAGALASAAATAARADAAHRKLAAQAEAVVNLGPVTQYGVAASSRLRAALALQEALRASQSLNKKTQALEELRAQLNAMLVAWKTRVRVVSLTTLDVEGPKTLAAQIGDLRGDFAAPTKHLTALGIIQNLLTLSIKAQQFEDVTPDIQALEAERQALADQLDRQAITCPKCHHQFNPKETHHGC